MRQRRWYRWLSLLLAWGVTGITLSFGWWWVAPLAGLVAGLPRAHPLGAFARGFLAVFLAWLVLLAWRLIAWRGLAQLAVVAALAHLPTAAGIAFALIPALVAALAAGCAAFALQRLRVS